MLLLDIAQPHIDSNAPKLHHFQLPQNKYKKPFLLLALRSQQRGAGERSGEKNNQKPFLFYE